MPSTRIKLVSYPRYVPVEGYERALETMAKRLSQTAGVQSIYQIGGVSDPGISDLDLMVVFEDSAKCHVNFLRHCSRDDRYLFCHSLVGVSSRHFPNVRHLPFFHNYRLIWGTEYVENGQRPQLTADDAAALKAQIALEYLLRMYITMTVGRTYGIMKVRNFLLMAKALIYDLEYLQVSAGPLYDAVSELIHLRKVWFDQGSASGDIRKHQEILYVALENFLADRLEFGELFLPTSGKLRPYRHLAIVSSDDFGRRHYGVTLPPHFAGLGRRYFNIQNRLNRFIFRIPGNQRAMPNVIRNRFELVRDLKGHNAQNLPHFMPPSAPLGNGPLDVEKLR